MSSKTFTITCYGKKNTYQECERRHQLDYYFNALSICEGSERERYIKVYLDLVSGKKDCNDEYWR